MSYLQFGLLILLLSSNKLVNGQKQTCIDATTALNVDVNCAHASRSITNPWAYNATLCETACRNSLQLGSLSVLKYVNEF